MKVKKNIFKIVSSFVIAGIFIFMQVGSGDSSSTSQSNELSKVGAESIIKILSSKEMKEKTDISGGHNVGEVEISLKMNEDKTFKYYLEESYITNTVSSINATGTYELVGSVQKVNTPGWTNKYGEDAGRYQFEQVIKFKGTTNKGSNFTLTAKLVQFGEKETLESKWFFSHDDYSSNNTGSPSVDNFRLPDEFIYP